MGSKQLHDEWAIQQEKGMGIQRVLFCFWTIGGAEGYVLAQKRYPYTVHHIRILGRRYVRWTLPGTMTVPELKKRIEDYFDKLGGYR